MGRGCTAELDARSPNIRQLQTVTLEDRLVVLDPVGERLYQFLNFRNEFSLAGRCGECLAVLRDGQKDGEAVALNHATWEPPSWHPDDAEVRLLREHFELLQLHMVARLSNSSGRAPWAASVAPAQVGPTLEVST